MTLFFKRLVNFVLNIFAVRANIKLEFVRDTVSEIHPQTPCQKA